MVAQAGGLSRAGDRVTNLSTGIAREPVMTNSSNAGLERTESLWLKDARRTGEWPIMEVAPLRAGR